MLTTENIKKSCFVTVWIFIWINSDTVHADVTKENIPRLNITVPFIDATYNDSVSIKCTGNSPLQWGYIDPTAFQDEIEILEIEANHQVKTNKYGNESAINLNFDSSEYTGRYTCYNSEFNASVYIFVDGGGKLLLPVFGMDIPFIHFHHGKSSVIPCLPTVSSANVTLWKVKGGSKEAVPLEFDPTMGFILKNPTDNFQKTFLCVADYKGRKSEMLMELETTRETESIPQVYINHNNAKYVQVGSTFQLECIVQTELNAFIKVNWTHPEIDPSRVIQKDLPTTKSRAYQNVTKELHIINARKSDEGSYKCNASDHSNRENYAEVYIKVYEIPQEPKVFFNPSHEKIIKNRTETVELIAHYDVFPFSTDIRAFWTKDKQPIVPGLKKYFAKTSESMFALEISNLSWKDSGFYAVTVNAPGGISEKTFQLRVKDKPLVNIQTNSSCCYSPGQNYTILCKVSGYPSATAFWSWKQYCLNDSSECNSSIESRTWELLETYLPINNSTVTVENDTENILSYLSVVADESGFYKCQGENSFGITSEEVIFIVSDAADGFEIECKNAFPVVNTYFTALCKVSSVLYADLFWKWIPISSNDSIIIPDGIRVSSNTSESVSLLLELKEVNKNLTGTYICVAYLRSRKGVEEKSIFVDVQDETAALVGQQSGADISTLVIASCIGLAFFIIVLLFMVTIVTRKRNRVTIIHDFDPKLFQEGRMALFDPNLPLDDQVDLLPYDDKWEFPKDKLKLGRTVGQGAFGRVVKAEAFEINDFESSTVVAVKMLKERADSNQQKALMDELKILIHLGHHVNIVNLMGAVTKNIPRGELMVIVEYCRYGNIRHYLHRHRDTFIDEVDALTGKVIPVSPTFLDEKGVVLPMKMEQFRRSSASSTGSVFAVDNPNYRVSPHREASGKSIINRNPGGSTTCHTIVYSTSGSSGSSGVFRNYYRADSQEQIITTSDLICYAFQCARGMEYLNSRKLIHRDLAARNVLLANDKIVKICDFGLAKDCYKYSNYIKKGDGPLPIKWMSIEAIWDHMFTTKSDVWSFGILMWEFFTLGGNPYPGIDIDEEFYKKLKAGYRMEKPEVCPNFVYEIMRDCWNADPDERPHFNQISDMLGYYLEDGVKQHYIDLNAPYMEMNRKLKVPDYSNLKEMECEEQRFYVNSEVPNEPAPYDVPLSNRSISDVPVPKEPMEVTPMIQLETISEASSEANVASNISGMLQVTDTYKPDYLQMGKTLQV